MRSVSEEPSRQLVRILGVVQQINRRVLRSDVMLTTSIAYGHFRYHGRLEFPGIEKNPIYGGAYVQAFLDNENGRPRIQPGQCRLTKRNLPEANGNLLSHDRSPLFELLQNERSHYQFYWMVDQKEDIDEFKKKYSDAYELKYAGILKALKNREEL